MISTTNCFRVYPRKVTNEGSEMTLPNNTVKRGLYGENSCHFFPFQEIFKIPEVQILTCFRFPTSVAFYSCEFLPPFFIYVPYMWNWVFLCFSGSDKQYFGEVCELKKRTQIQSGYRLREFEDFEFNFDISLPSS